MLLVCIKMQERLAVYSKHYNAETESVSGLVTPDFGFFDERPRVPNFSNFFINVLK